MYANVVPFQEQHNRIRSKKMYINLLYAYEAQSASQGFSFSVKYSVFYIYDTC